ncbi:unnamed protein product [Sympodiomycopsis kandeliae]
MASTIPDIAAVLQLEDPDSLTHWRINVLLSASSSETAKAMLGVLTLYEIVFALPKKLTANAWPKLLVETNYDGGVWLERQVLIAPEMSIRWSIFSFFTLIAASCGFPAEWALRVGEDKDEKTVIQEDFANMGFDFRFQEDPTKTQQKEPSVPPRAASERAKLAELVQWMKDSNQSDIYLVLKGGDVAAMKSGSQGISREEIAGMIPAHFAASGNVEGVPRQRLHYPSGACCLSNFKFSTEGAHLFDAGVSPALIKAILQALKERSPPPAQSSGELFQKLVNDCGYLLKAGSDDDRVLQGETNIIPLDLSLHQALDRRASAGGQSQAAMLIEPFEGRVGLCSRTALPAAYVAAVVSREASLSNSAGLDIAIATYLMGLCGGKEPWKSPSSTFLKVLRERTISPGLLAKSCENLFQTFASKAFRSRVNEIAKKTVAYFSDRKRKAPEGDDSDADDDGGGYNDDDDTGGTPGPSAFRRPTGRSGEGGGAGGAGEGSGSGRGANTASRSRGATSESGTTRRSETSNQKQTEHQPSWMDLEALHVLLIAYVEARQLPDLSTAFDGIHTLAKLEQEPAWHLHNSGLRHAWAQQSLLLKEDRWSWNLYESMVSLKEAQAYQAAWIYLLGGLPVKL